MEPGDDEALWRLLGRVRGVEASPYFARRVLREVILDEEGRGRAVAGGGWLAGLRPVLVGRRMATWPAAAVVAVFWLSVVLTTNRPAPAPVAGNVAHRASSPAMAPVMRAGAAANPAAGTGTPSRTAAVPEDVAAQDVEVIADLDNLMTREESRLWTEDTARF